MLTGEAKPKQDGIHKWIEFNGRYYTELELAEHILPRLDDMHKKAVGGTIQVIKNNQKLIKTMEESIASSYLFLFTLLTMHDDIKKLVKQAEAELKELK